MVRQRVIAVIGALGLVVAGCGAGEPTGSDGPDEVTVGLISILDVAPIYLGKQQGFFAERDIELTLEPAEAGTETIPAVLNEHQQFGFSNVVTLLVARAQGLPVTVVSNGINSTGVVGGDFGSLMVNADSPVRTVRDLAGRKVAVNVLENVVELGVRASARAGGVDPDAIEYVKLPFPEMPAALAAGQVDAAFVVEPFQQVVRAQGGREVASSMVDIAPDLTVAMYFTAERLAAENPDLVARFTEAMAESLAYADAHPDDARAILPSYTQIPPEVIPELTLPEWPAEINRDSVTAVAEQAVREGILPTVPDLDALLP
ncbi:ABC transporter substrate-binding protein [Actinophytocola sediminis]